MTNQAPQPSRQEKTIGPPPIAEIEVLWITAGLGCDGDTIAMTAATQPSIEEVVLGALPWIPKSEPTQSLPGRGQWRRLPAAFGNIQAVRPGIPVLRVSAKTGEGMQEYLEWLGTYLTEVRSAAV